MVTLICSFCQKEYSAPTWRAKVSKYCSQKCYGFSERGRIPKSAWKKGQIVSPETQFKAGSKHPYFGSSSPALGKHWRLTAETKRKMSKSQKGVPHLKTSDELHYGWKGTEVGYRGLHTWVERKLGKPSKCENCGKTSLNHREFHWANKSRLYLRDLNDWLRLCVKCHKEYDKLPE